MTFGERLQQVIAAHRTTPAEMVKRADGAFTLQWLQNYTGSKDNPAEGNPTLSVLLKIAKAIPASVDELVEGLDAEYDATRRRVSAAERFAAVWTRIDDPEARRDQWRILLRAAGIEPSDDDAGPPVGASTPDTSADPTPASTR